MKRKVKGQILVIILLVISILSIFILAMVSNARRDSQETRANKIYEQYYSIGEAKLIEAQEIVGIGQMPELNILNSRYRELLGNTTTTPCTVSNATATQSNVVYACTMTQAMSQYDKGSLDVVKSTVYFTDSPELGLYNLPSDNNLRVTLKNNTTVFNGLLYLYWNSQAGQTVNWEISLDYYQQNASNHVAQFKTFKVSDLVANGYVYLATNDKPTQYSYKMIINVGLIRSTGIPGIPDADIGFLRIKPLIGITGSKVVSIGLYANNNSFPAQFRKITSVVSSATTANTGDTSATPILNMEYPLSTPINPLLDYVYRGGYWEQILQTE